jgi:hypothetical protein
VARWGGVCRDRNLSTDTLATWACARDIAGDWGMGSKTRGEDRRLVGFIEHTDFWNQSKHFGNNPYILSALEVTKYDILLAGVAESQTIVSICVTRSL